MEIPIIILIFKGFLNNRFFQAIINFFVQVQQFFQDFPKKNLFTQVIFILIIKINLHLLALEINFIWPRFFQDFLKKNRFIQLIFILIIKIDLHLLALEINFLLYLQFFQDFLNRIIMVIIKKEIINLLFLKFFQDPNMKNRFILVIFKLIKDIINFLLFLQFFQNFL